MATSQKDNGLSKMYLITITTFPSSPSEGERFGSYTQLNSAFVSSWDSSPPFYRFKMLFLPHIVNRKRFRY